MFTAHTVIEQKGYFRTKGHPPFDGKRVTRDSDPHVRPDVQATGGRVPREAGGGVLGEPWTHGHSREPVPRGPQSAEQGTGPKARVSLPSHHLPRPQAQDYVRIRLQQTSRGPSATLLAAWRPRWLAGNPCAEPPPQAPSVPKVNASVYGVSFRFLKT